MGDKILVVDDEWEIRDMLSRFLTGQGFEVATASSGEEAIELVKIENPRIVLLDIKMPGIDGIEVCKRLRAQEQTRLIPIIMITALGDQKMHAVQAGADDFVNKPFDLVDISVRVKSVLHVLHLTDELDRLTACIEDLKKNLPEA